MTVHCFDVIYSPSSQMDSFLDTWLTNWKAWTEENLDSPQELTFTDIDTDATVTASGFQQNRFIIQDSSRTIEEDARYIMSQLINQNGYLASYCSWWIVRWHQCDHDEDNRTGCGSWQVIDSSNNYSGQQDVPSEVPQ